MPIHEFKCPEGHITEQMFRTFKEAEGVANILCPRCKRLAERIEFSVPRPAHFYGRPDGYHKPSPTKRHSYKVVKKQTGNKFSGG